MFSLATFLLRKVIKLYKQFITEYVSSIRKENVSVTMTLDDKSIEMSQLMKNLIKGLIPFRKFPT